MTNDECQIMPVAAQLDAGALSRMNARYLRLAAWERIAPDLHLVVSDFVADQGENASAELIKLQHALTDLKNGKLPS